MSTKRVVWLSRRSNAHHSQIPPVQLLRIRFRSMIVTGESNPSRRCNASAQALPNLGTFGNSPWTAAPKLTSLGTVSLLDLDALPTGKELPMHDYFLARFRILPRSFDNWYPGYVHTYHKGRLYTGVL
ncbi:hypothetical protein PILCRDRAFT_3275 [Piloderma croceum F 1598]|uniref:Uncharacterized protein n=1 Tax=Piloderma croceum (strain F 1598) TaxID=765440 RepID=A0A0C3FV12_PILCF|nr:hypothetical protein PILCRDRAFT_3275 [Piloderma croceum F 1598]